jgi:hypothetical protein
VWFDAGCSYDPDGYITTYEWDTGEFFYWGPYVSHTYYYPGSYPVWLTVWDDKGAPSSIYFGNVYVY